MTTPLSPDNSHNGKI